MSLDVCLCADTIGFPDGGGHAWAYLNWALGLKNAGCDVIWLEEVGPRVPFEKLHSQFTNLQQRLQPYGLADRIVILQVGRGCLSESLPTTPLEEAAQAELLVNLRYGLDCSVVRSFRRSVMVDIDPGLTQIWMYHGQIEVAPHTLYYSIGETVGTPEALFPDGGRKWRHTPPPVSLDAWPVCPASPDAPFRTVSNWWDEWFAHHGASYDNSKRAGFLPYFDLPRHTSQKLELAISLAADQRERAELEPLGWTVKRAEEVAGTPSAYQSYLQTAKGEFSCAKPSYTRLETAWVSDRTICFLASGKPAVVQHTGKSRYLPDADGLLRFQTPTEAVAHLETIAADYPKHAKRARALAEEHFDARKVTTRILTEVL